MFGKSNENFHVLIVTNDGQPDLDCGNHDKFIKLYKQQTRHYIDCLMEATGIPEGWLNRHFKICRMGNHKPTYFIHSKIMIVDGKKGVLSSTNLTDRSLRKDIQDRELGIKLECQKGLTQELMTQMLNTYSTGERGFSTVKEAMHQIDSPQSLLVSEKPFSATNIPAKKAGLMAFGATAKTAAHGIFW